MGEERVRYELLGNLAIEVEVGCGSVGQWSRVGEDRLAELVSVVDEGLLRVLRADRDAVGLVDSRLEEGVVVGDLEAAEGAFADALHPEFLLDILPLEDAFAIWGDLGGIIVERDDDLAVLERRVVLHESLHVDRDHHSEPAVEVDNIWSPAQFASRLEDAACEEDSAFVVIVEEGVSLRVGDSSLACEEVIVVDEVDLHSSGGDASDLDDEGVVGIVDDDIKARESDNLVEHVASFVDVAEAWHKSTDVATSLDDSLRELARQASYRAVREVGFNLLRDVQNFRILHILLISRR